jgi:hypothetical protein
VSPRNSCFIGLTGALSITAIWKRRKGSPVQRCQWP